MKKRGMVFFWGKILKKIANETGEKTYRGENV